MCIFKNYPIQQDTQQDTFQFQIYEQLTNNR
jgi:hypothetical protein